MALTSDILSRLASIDMPAESYRQVLQLFADMQAGEDARKAKQRDRTRRSRYGNVTVTSDDCDSDVTVTVTPPPEVPPKDITQTPLLTSPSLVETRAQARTFDLSTHDFDRFWQRYPHKVGKLDAERVFDRIRKANGVPFEDLISGLERYIRGKPPDRPWCNPATWLNQGRWADEPAPTSPVNPSKTSGTSQNGSSVVHAGIDLVERLKAVDDRLRPDLRGGGGDPPIRLLEARGRG